MNSSKTRNDCIPTTGKKPNKKQRQLMNKRLKATSTIIPCNAVLQSNIITPIAKVIEVSPKINTQKILISEPTNVILSPPETSPVAFVIPSLTLEETTSTILNSCFNLDLTLFGSYVRDYMFRLKFDYAVSDIDVFSNLIKSDKFVEVLTKDGVLVIPDTNKTITSKYTDHKSFTVEHFIVNCSDGILKIDFVSSSTATNMEPPFNVLDFECNAFIWDKNGIRLSRNTGSALDTLDPRGKKEKEVDIIISGRNKITNYIPFSCRGQIMSPISVYWRKTRVQRIIKMLTRGWTISNLESLSYASTPIQTRCDHCSQSIDHECVTFNCCNSSYHPDCFAISSCISLDTSAYINCPNGCTSLTI